MGVFMCIIYWSIGALYIIEQWSYIKVLVGPIISRGPVRPGEYGELLISAIDGDSFPLH